LLPSTYLDLSEAEIAHRLAAAHPEDAAPEHQELAHLLPGAPRPAAVIIPFLCQDQRWQVLFTRRNNDLPEHSGQVAFPGGRSEPGDASSVQTALREMQEEIGINPADVRILGTLRRVITITNYEVTPVIGVIPWPYPLRLQTSEVSRAFTIPLEWLADPAHHEERRRGLPHPLPAVNVIYFQPYDGEVLWGASARFMLSLLELLK
jgi:8-oxo-dGTP pyrophosphatase MutT (NUDIX family)